MIFFSQLLNHEVLDAGGRKVGVLSDLVISRGEVFPHVTALVILLSKGRGLPILNGTATVPWSQVTNLEEKPIRLKVPQEEVTKYTLKDRDLLLGKDILDKQIVDTQGRRIVKVNDLKLAQIGGVARLVGADVSLRAFLRRLGGEGLSRLLRIPLPERLITWNYVEPLGADLANVRLSIPSSKIADLHPADIADLIEQMELLKGTAVLEGLTDQVAADTLSELEPPLQTSYIQQLDSERASDLLEILPPDEAADILGDLSEEKAEELLSHMAAAEAHDVRELMAYDEHSAGGIMTTDVLRLQKGLTTEEALARLREAAPGPEVVYYLFVVDPDDHLVGVISLRDLVISPSTTRIEQIMNRDVIKVRVDADQEEVARLIAKYDLLAIPVVDNHNHLRGIVTVDDVVDVLQEEANKDISQIAGISVGQIERPGSTLSEAIDRLAWLTVGLAGGLVAGLVIRTFAASIQSALSLVYFIPLLLVVAGGTFAQSVGAIGRATNVDRRGHMLFRELQIAGFMSVVSGVCVTALVFAWARNLTFGLIIGASLSFTILVAAIAGALLSLLASDGRITKMVFSSPALQPTVAVLSVSLYLGLATYLIDHIS